MAKMQVNGPFPRPGFRSAQYCALAGPVPAAVSHLAGNLPPSPGSPAFTQPGRSRNPDRRLILRGTIAPAGEVLVNLGGEPERDDSGLPPVDIVVPDDARELDRDVQAYHRELRAVRRQARRMRLHGPLTRDGVILPLLASCLVLALIAGTLLTVFSVPGTDLPGPGALAPTAARGDSPTAVPVAARLPAGASLELYGTKVPLTELTRTVLALVPAACDCSGTLARLVRQARTAGVSIYLVGGEGLASVSQVTQQAASVTPPVITADDPAGALARAFIGHGGPPARGPTAVLVPADGPVAVTPPLSAGFKLSGQLNALSSS
jgi:hypothetical protein